MTLFWSVLDLFFMILAFWLIYRVVKYFCNLNKQIKHIEKTVEEIHNKLDK